MSDGAREDIGRLVNLFRKGSRPGIPIGEWFGGVQVFTDESLPLDVIEARTREGVVLQRFKVSE